MYPSLREFVAALEREGQLERVREETSPVLEIAARADRESKRATPGEPSACSLGNDPRRCRLGGNALLFENVTGSDMPVLINALGSYRRMEMAIGAPDGFDALAERIGELVKPEPPRSLKELWGALKKYGPLLRIPPRTVRRGACQEIVTTGDAIDLTRLPIIKCWPLDGDLASVGYPAGINDGIPGLDLINDPVYQGRYITFAGIHTIHADDAGVAKPASHNIGMYRVQLLGRKRLAMHWHMHHDGARHWRSWKERGEKMPVAIALGGESALPFAAIAPLPPGISELLYAGFLNGKGIPMVKCKTVPLRVPANAEIVIEGYVSNEAGGPGYDPREDGAGPIGPGAVFEGPFGDHTGYYSLPDRYPIVEVTAVTTRRDPIFPATVVGLPPQEDYWMGKGVERLFLPLLRTITPDVADYDLPMFGTFHNCAVMQIKKEYPFQARRMMASVWGAGQMAWTKMVIVVDDDVDVHDEHDVLRAIGEHCAPNRDIELMKGPLDILDHAAPSLGAGTKIGFDATRKWADEIAASTPQVNTYSAEARPGNYVGSPAEDLLCDVHTPSSLGGNWAIAHGTALALGVPSTPYPGVKFLVIVDNETSTSDVETALFQLAANTDPGRDTLIQGSQIIFDARSKVPNSHEYRLRVRDWPPVIVPNAPRDT